MVAVAAEQRGYGIGRKLVESLMGDDPGITWVLRAAPGSKDFWEKMGFKGSSVAMERARK
jgi:N-acetylglutamate synthase-like GNAT family acetyltransferase